MIGDLVIFVLYFQTRTISTTFVERGNNNFSARKVAYADIDISKQPAVITRTNPPEWKFVERILIRKTIPELVPKAEYPSGWRPQQDRAFEYPFYIKRTKSHMVPVYLKLGFRNQRKRTIIKNIKGDIWALHTELNDYVCYYMARKQRTRVNEYSGTIVFNGDHVNLLRDYLVDKGF